MAKYSEYKSRRFVLKKDAINWAKSEKKKLALGGTVPKIETNFKPDLGQWEAVLYMKMD